MSRFPSVPPQRFVAESPSGTVQVVKPGTNYAAARAAVKLLRKRPMPVHVHLTHSLHTESRGGLDVQVAPENELRITITSGIPKINVLGGKVVIEALSSWGNVIHAHAGTHVTVISNSYTKVTIYAHPDATVDVEVPEKNRTHLYSTERL